MLTYSDMIEHAVDYLGGGANDRMQSPIRRAVINAYQRLTSNAKGWDYYIVDGRVNLNGLYSTGTITYTASTRTFVIAGGSWPSWAIYGQIRVANVVYDVESVSGTSLIVTSGNSPVSNIAAGTAFKLFQSQYTVPSDFQDIYIVTSSSFPYQSYITPEEWFTIQRIFAFSGTPRYWTIAGSTNPKYGRKSLLVDPAPSTDAPHVFLYRRMARELRYSGSETASNQGTVTLTVGSATITGVGTAFNARMVGSVIRVSDSTTDIPGGLGSLNPYTEEFVIKAFSDSTHVVATAAAVSAYTAVKYRISDPIDIDDCMIAPMRSGVEFEIEKTRNSSDAALARAKNLYTADLMSAWAIDAQSGIARAGVSWGYDYYREPYTVNTNLISS